MLTQSVILAEQNTLERNYGRSIRSAVRLLWSGDIRIDDFFAMMSSTIERGLTRAWFDGAARCGIRPDELTTKETDALRRLIIKEKSYIFNFGIAIESGNQESGGKLKPFLDRAAMWVQRPLQAFQLGESYACADKKKMWRLGQREHCNDCPRLDGKVKRLSWWREHNLIPRTPGQATQCAGWKCGCDLVDTDLPLSRGRMPVTG